MDIEDPALQLHVSEDKNDSDTCQLKPSSDKISGFAETTLFYQSNGQPDNPITTEIILEPDEEITRDDQNLNIEEISKTDDTLLESSTTEETSADALPAIEDGTTVSGEVTLSVETYVLKDDNIQEEVIIPSKIYCTDASEAHENDVTDAENITFPENNHSGIEISLEVEGDVREDDDLDILKDQMKTDDEHTLNAEVVIESTSCDSMEDQESANKLLSQLEGQSIDLGEALRSTSVSESGDNNNCFNKQQEVLNKKELLDILEGNDEEMLPASDTKRKTDLPTSEPLVKRTVKYPTEAELALRQLSKLPRRNRNQLRNTKMSREQDTRVSKEKIVKKKLKETKNETDSPAKVESPKKNESIVKVLEEDWADDEINDDQSSDDILNDAKSLLEESADVIKGSEILMKTSEDLSKDYDRASIDSTMSQDSEDRNSQSSNPNKSGDETAPQRRMSRVIKKKVIFDPDNPDTFTTSGKAVNVNNKVKTVSGDKEYQPVKKIKCEAVPLRAKSKSPTTKGKNVLVTHWKKPQPKTNKQHKRLTEVDRLLMDEGAVNMIYQLKSNVPEAPKGKKNIRSKAEFIKKINQSSTPDDNEMKFRERRKDTPKLEDSEAKRVLYGKQSLNNSIKSPAVCDDFEAHSADDSIIYRRHSSSSYSSSCLSPRRLSDVEAGSTQAAARAARAECRGSTDVPIKLGNGEKSMDVFMPEDMDSSSNEVIDKKDCLSLKEKLNSKLSRVLNFKRKREGGKGEKPLKQKKVVDKQIDKHILAEFRQLSVTIKNNIAEIKVQETGSENNAYNVETLKELERALDYADKQAQVSVTLLTSQCGNLCAGLDFKPLSTQKPEKKTKCAYEIADSVRSVLASLGRHSKLVVTGVAGTCEGLALAMLVLCDVAVASDRASFALIGAGQPPTIAPGTAVLTAHPRALPRSLVNEMLVFGRRLSATEALQRGLISRTLWPDRFNEELRAMVRDIAAQPLPTVLLKKQLLNLRSGAQKDSTFLACLDAERDLLVQYWSSNGSDVDRSCTGS